MRGIFSGLALVLVLAAVGFAAMKQLKTSAVSPSAGSALPASSAAASAAATPQQVPQHAAQEVNKALQQGAARNEEAMK
jgi:hypothetical protein